MAGPLIDEAAIAAAAETLRAGGLVAFPTETVYGLGADATNDRAVAAVFAAKGRPSFNPLITHAARADVLWDLVVPDDRALRLAEAFWPGPLTMVLPRRPDCAISALARAGLDTAAVRVPRHPVAMALFEAAGVPVVGPSANRSGSTSPTLAAHVRASLGDRVAMVLDGGACAVGLESTVVDLSVTPAVVLRPGGLTEEAIAKVIGAVGCRGGKASAETVIRAPGMLERHYAPRHSIRLIEPCADVVAKKGEALLAFGSLIPSGFAKVLNLSASADLDEAAAHLFDALHVLDAEPISGIAAMKVPETGLGVAINDRLRRAAAEGD